MNIQVKGTLPPHLRLFDPFSILEPEKTAAISGISDKEIKLSSPILPVENADVLEVVHNFQGIQEKHSPKNSVDEELIKFFDRYDTQNVAKLIDLDDADATTKNMDSDGKAKLKDSEGKEIVESLLDIALENLRLSEAMGYTPIVNKTHNKPIKVNDNSPDTTDKALNHLKELRQTVPNMEPSRIIPATKGPISQTSATPLENTNKKVLIETVLKDQIKFCKRRIIKAEKEIAMYSKGASLFEKKVVLPQIMERMTKRKIACDLKNNLRRKLLLDTGKTVPNDDIPNQSTQRDIPQSVEDNKQQIDKVKENLSESKDKIDAIIDDSISNKNNIEAAKILNSDVKDIQLWIYKELAKKANEQAATSQSSEESDGSFTNDVLRPEVLMDNCNKQRIVEFQRRKLFRDFVCNGKIS